jgi:hypothetical protein
MASHRKRLQSKASDILKEEKITLKGYETGLTTFTL